MPRREQRNDTGQQQRQQGKVCKRIFCKLWRNEWKKRALRPSQTAPTPKSKTTRQKRKRLSQGPGGLPWEAFYLSAPPGACSIQ